MTPDVSRGTSPTSERSTSQNPTSENLDLSTWLTKQQAADAIGVSTKTIEQFAKDGKIQQAVWRPQNRGAAKAVYQPDDVARIAADRKPGLAPFVLPAGVTLPVNGNGHPTGIQLGSKVDATPTGEEVLRLVFAAALRTLAAEPPMASENPSEKTSETPKLFLTIEEAATVSGLSRACLRKLIADGSIRGIRDRGWKIARRDLEAL